MIDFPFAGKELMLDQEVPQNYRAGCVVSWLLVPKKYRNHLVHKRGSDAPPQTVLNGASLFLRCYWSCPYRCVSATSHYQHCHCRYRYRYRYRYLYRHRRRYLMSAPLLLPLSPSLPLQPLSLLPLPLSLLMLMLSSSTDSSFIIHGGKNKGREASAPNRYDRPGQAAMCVSMLMSCTRLMMAEVFELKDTILSILNVTDTLLLSKRQLLTYFANTSIIDVFGKYVNS
jgi:hypothetical protein